MRVCVRVCVRVSEGNVFVHGGCLTNSTPPPQWYLCIIRHMLVGTNYYTSNQSSLAR